MVERVVTPADVEAAYDQLVEEGVYPSNNRVRKITGGCANRVCEFLREIRTRKHQTLDAGVSMSSHFKVAFSKEISIIAQKVQKDNDALFQVGLHNEKELQDELYLAQEEIHKLQNSLAESEKLMTKVKAQAETWRDSDAHKVRGLEVACDQLAKDKQAVESKLSTVIAEKSQTVLLLDQATEQVKSLNHKYESLQCNSNDLKERILDLEKSNQASLSRAENESLRAADLKSALSELKKQLADEREFRLEAEKKSASFEARLQK